MHNYPLRIIVRPLLVCANTGSGPNGIFIMLADDLPRDEAAVSLWHEFVHIFKRIGDREHLNTAENEAEVEAIAKKLAACCPEILDLCGVGEKFKSAPTAE